MNDAAARAEIVEVGRRLYARGLVHATAGNITMRLGPGRILATPSGPCKGYLRPEDMVVVDEGGALVEGTGSPSSEIRLHLEVYARRPDVLAVVHAHPPVATAFAACNLGLTELVLPEVVVPMGRVPLAPYGTPGTAELPATIRPLIEQHDAILLANHGVVTSGVDVFDALYKMETVESFATILLMARQLGGPVELTDEQVSKLMAIRRAAGLVGRNPLDRATGHAGVDSLLR
jgi:L-fuculose-phosphate aldolase